MLCINGLIILTFICNLAYCKNYFATRHEKSLLNIASDEVHDLKQKKGLLPYAVYVSLLNPLIAKKQQKKHIDNPKPKVHNESQDRVAFIKLSNDTFLEESLDEDLLLEHLFRRKGGSCRKGATKACKSACKRVLKDVCHVYNCKKGKFKSTFKKKCNNNCQDSFSDM